MYLIIRQLLYGALLGYLVGYIYFTLFRPNNKIIHESINDIKLPKNENFNALFQTKDEFKDQKVYENVRLLCWIMTSPSNHETKAIHVKATWGRRCDVLLFMSSMGDFNLPAIALPVDEGRNNLWAKTKEAFRYVYENYLEQADWFLKADDDTYVIVENLKYMLANHNTSEPMYFGWRFKHYVKQGFMSGGAGYVLSKAALKKFIVEAIPNATICRSDNDGNEDTELGRCMENIGVKAMNTRDSFGRERFFPVIPTKNLIPGHTPPDNWYYMFSYYPVREGRECCSEAAISFHYVNPQMMYVIERFVYGIRPYGIDRRIFKPL